MSGLFFALDVFLLSPLQTARRVVFKAAELLSS